MFPRFAWAFFWVISMVLCSTAAFAGKMELTTYYPAPYGEYKELRSTENAYFATTSGSKVGIGTSTPYVHSILDVNTSGDKAIHTMDDVKGGLLIGYKGSTIQARTTGEGNIQNLLLNSWGGNVVIGDAGLNPGDMLLEVTGLADKQNAIRVGSLETLLNGVYSGANTYTPARDGEVAASVIHLERRCGNNPGEHCPEIGFQDTTSMKNKNNANVDIPYDFVIKAAADSLTFFNRGGTTNDFLSLYNLRNGSKKITDSVVRIDAKSFYFHETCLNGCSSDSRLKENIQPLSGSLEIISQLKPSRFEFIDKARGEGVQYGLIAQDVEKVMPEWVTTGDDGYKRINYGPQIQMHLIEAVKEQQQQIELLKKEVLELKKR